MDKIKVALIKCDNYELSEVKSAINRGIDLLGGIDLFIKGGDKILLKPNLLASESAEKSVTTHPIVFEAIISILQEIKEKKNIKKIKLFSQQKGCHEPLKRVFETSILQIKL